MSDIRIVVCVVSGALLAVSVDESATRYEYVAGGLEYMTLLDGLVSLLELVKTRLDSFASTCLRYLSLLANWLSISIGMGKIIVEFFSAATVVSVCKYLSCSATGLWLITSAASFSACEAFCSPSAEITLAFASLLASASAAMARCMLLGRRTSFISTRSTLIPQSSVAVSRTFF